MSDVLIYRPPLSRAQSGARDVEQSEELVVLEPTAQSERALVILSVGGLRLVLRAEHIPD